MEVSRFDRRSLEPEPSLPSPLSPVPAAVDPEGMPFAVAAEVAGAEVYEADEADEDEVCVVFSVCVCVAFSCLSRSVHRSRILPCRESQS